MQNNVQNLTDWVVPNGWTINGGTLTTPIPAQGAVGPRDEGSGTTFNMGDAYTRATYPNGFELKVDYSFATEYLQPDNDGNEIIRYGAEEDFRKVSFVANSGVKIGSLDATNRYEVAIIDMARWVGLTQGIEALSITGDMIDLSPYPPSPGYRDEECSRLIPGMLYKGEYKSGSGENSLGLTDAAGLTTPLTPRDYRDLLGRTLGCWDNTSMIIVADPNATDGIIKVYVKLKDIDHSDHNHSETTHPAHTEYHLFYRTNVDREGSPIVINENTRAHLQSHWGSGVAFTNVSITPLSPP